MKIHDLITTTDALANLCERLSKSEFVTVDTEFMRENTYWPELCLVQIANDKEAAAIDPLAGAVIKFGREAESADASRNTTTPTTARHHVFVRYS